MGPKGLQPFWVATSGAGKRRISKAQAKQDVLVFLGELAIQREGRKSLGPWSCDMVRFLRRCCGERWELLMQPEKKDLQWTRISVGANGMGASQYINVIYAPSTCIN